jgi:alginate O-acetyltransferase complex protein AlgJ
MKNIFVSIFCLILSLPLFQMLTHVIPEVPFHENRKKVEFPPYRNMEEFGLFLKDFDLYFKDNFGMRSYLVKLELSLNYFLFKETPMKDVIIGKEGWLYYDPKKNDGTTMEDFYGIVNYTPEKLNLIQTKLHNLNEFLKSKNIRFLFFITPNKNSIYSEYLPTNINSKKANFTRYDQIKDILVKEGIETIDLKTIFFEKKNQEKRNLYYKTDSHWNYLGAYYGYKSILDKLKIHSNDYTFQETYHPGGDLASMLSIDYLMFEKDYISSTDILTQSECKTIYSKDSFYCLNNENSQGLVMYRDSFSIWLVPYLKQHFSRSVYLWGTANIDLSLIVKEKADIVIIQIVERHLDNLLILYEDELLKKLK